MDAPLFRRNGLCLAKSGRASIARCRVPRVRGAFLGASLGGTTESNAWPAFCVTLFVQVVL